MKFKPKYCSMCGCDRLILFKGDIEIQDHESRVSYKVSRACVTCLLSALVLIKFKVFDYKKAMECVSDELSKADEKRGGG